MGVAGAADSPATNGGSIGAVTIGMPAATTSAATAARHAIEAETLGVVTWGGVVVASDNTVTNTGSGAYSPVRVRTI
jgi:hypothetical protein